MILLTNEDVEPLLKMPDCIEAIEAAFADLGNGDAVDIPRQDAIVPIGREGAVHDLKTMSGTWPKAGIAAIRLNSDIVTGSVVNGTSRRVKLALSEPGGRYNGQVLLFSTDTGQLLCIINDGIMQRTRVGATSGVAAKYLARSDVKVLGLLGTGLPGRWPARSDVRGPRVRGGEGVQSYARQSPPLRRALSQGAGPEHPRGRPTRRRGPEGADVLVTATNSLAPTVKPEWLKPGMHLSSVNRTELLPAIFERVDAAHRERPRRRKELHRAQLARGRRLQSERPQRPLRHRATFRTCPSCGTWCRAARRAGNRASEITCFHNYQGLGLQFAAIGAIVYREAAKRKIGLKLDDRYFTQTVHP